MNRLICLLFILPALTFAAEWEGTYKISGYNGGVNIGSCKGTFCKVSLKVNANGGVSKCQFEAFLNMSGTNATLEIGDCLVNLSQKGQDMNVSTDGSCPYCEGGIEMGGFYQRDQFSDNKTIMDSQEASVVSRVWRGNLNADGMVGGIQVTRCSGTECEVSFNQTTKQGDASCNLSGTMNFYDRKMVEGKIGECQLRLKKGYPEITVEVLNDCESNVCDKGIKLATQYRPLKKKVMVAPDKKTMVDNVKDGNLKALWRKIKAYFE